MATLAASSYLVLARTPLRFMGGLTDDWFALGINVAFHATLGIGEEPVVMRPPGYPFLLAALMRVTTPLPARVTPAYLDRTLEIVYLAQCLLLAAATVCLYALLLRKTSIRVAFAAACAFGLNPYALLLPGLLHYDVLHLLLVVLSTSALARVVARESTTGIAMFGCGVLWGLTTLVRPTSLLLPPFVLVLLLAQRSSRWRKAVAGVVVFTAGLAATVAPWTARNYAVSGRLVPVNAQGWSVLWGSTVIPLDFDANRYHWRSVGLYHLLPVYQRVTGLPDYDVMAYMRHDDEINAALRQEAIANIGRQPGLYARNVARSMLTLSLQINSALVSTFERIQQPGVDVSQDWFWGEDHPKRRPTAASRGLEWLFAVLTALALLGALTGLRRRDDLALTLGLVYACFCLAHGITFMDFMYYFIKLPFLAAFAALGLSWLESRRFGIRLGSRSVSVAAALCLGLATWSVVLSLMIL